MLRKSRKHVWKLPGLNRRTALLRRKREFFPPCRLKKCLFSSLLGLGAPQVALVFTAFGAGSMLAAVLLPRVLERLADRPAMLSGAGLMVAGVAMVPLASGLAGLMGLWAVIDFGFAFTQIRIGRILNRSARPEDRPAVFAAQFALSHAAWLVTYPLAGWFGSAFGLPTAALGLAALGTVSMVAVIRLWTATDTAEVPHAHPDLPADHLHLRGHADAEHRHALMIDDLHRRWPRATGSIA